MARHGLFAKDVHIRLTDAGTGFSYTVKYGWLRLPPRRVRVLEEGEELLGVEVRVDEDYRSPRSFGTEGLLSSGRGPTRTILTRAA